MGLHVLIVDDSTLMRSVLRKTVHLSGYDVGRYIEASNGKEALDVLALEWVDLILLDVHMPVMDGLAMLRQMQENELYKQIPVVLVTTEANRETIEEAFRLGAKAHLRKPFQPEALRGILMKILGDEYARQNGPDLAGIDF